MIVEMYKTRIYLIYLKIKYLIPNLKYKIIMRKRRKRLGIKNTYKSLDKASKELVIYRAAFYKKGGSPLDKDCPDLFDFIDKSL